MVMSKLRIVTDALTEKIEALSLDQQLMMITSVCISYLEFLEAKFKYSEF